LLDFTNCGQLRKFKFVTSESPIEVMLREEPEEYSDNCTCAYPEMSHLELELQRMYGAPDRTCKFD